MTGFISTLVTSYLTLKYNAIADLQTFQFTVARTLEFSVFMSRLLAMDRNTETITLNHYEVFLFSITLYSCPNLYSTNLHNSLGTSILVLLLSSAPSL
jgi:hypothetical protein